MMTEVKFISRGVLTTSDMRETSGLVELFLILSGSGSHVAFTLNHTLKSLH